MLRHFAPAGLNHAVRWHSRFRAIGFDQLPALRATLSRPMRDALVFSRIERLPAAFRGRFDFVVDIGANAGQWIKAFMTFAEVHCLETFEPNPEAFAALQKLLAGRPHTRLHNVALGDESTTAVLNVMQNSGLSSLRTPNEMLRLEYATAAEVAQQISVKVARLDDVLDDDRTIDLIKLDVQGFEHEVLRGAHRTLQRTRALLVETNFASHYSGDGNFASLFTHLNENGFDFWDMSDAYRGSQTQALWADAVFLNRSSSRLVPKD